MKARSSRGDFLKYSGLATASLFVPEFLRAGTFTGNMDTRPRVLVVIQFSGGNDGLNCVVPFRNDLYHKLRPTIGYTPDALIHLTDDIGLNPNLQSLADLYFNGDVVLINNVGYPNPNRSHFRSMDIWQSASDEDVYLQSGWLGRVLDASCDNSGCAQPHMAIELDDTLSLALKGSKASGFAMRNPNTLKASEKNPVLIDLAADYAEAPSDSHQVEYLHKTLADTVESASYIYAKSKIYSSQKVYPATEFGSQLKVIAELIISECETSVYYVSLSGFDTHAFQKGQQERQLKVFADALKVFCEDLKQNGKFNDTLVMTFSEFGRRVEENASKGTDHGTANNIYLIGGGMRRGGIMNDLPDLTQLDQGDLVYSVDFRSVYATLLDGWLHADPEKVLGRQFPQLDFL